MTEYEKAIWKLRKNVVAYMSLALISCWGVTKGLIGCGRNMCGIDVLRRFGSMYTNR